MKSSATPLIGILILLAALSCNRCEDKGVFPQPFPDYHVSRRGPIDVIEDGADLCGG